MELRDLIEAHAGHVALQFSGGRDSVAMLLSLRDVIGKVTVYYTNSGDAYPETLGLVEAVRKVCPAFVEIDGAVHKTRGEFGWPSDVLPAGATWMYGKENIADHLRLQDRHDCCLKSIMVPMHERMKADGITLILRGQRDSDEPKSHVKNGETVDGFTIAYPIADWSTERVESYIKSFGMAVPAFYADGMTSAPDCMHCTAWLEHGALKYLKKHHPISARIVNDRLSRIRVKVEPFVAKLAATQEEFNG